jgi:Concanavalin A-like lectin/glucanases superfamily
MARLFDGVDDIAVRTSAEAAFKPTNNFTVSIWYKPSSSPPTSEILSMGDNYLIRHTPGSSTVEFTCHIGGGWPSAVWTYSAGQFNNEVWHNIVGVKRSTGTGIELYVDGVSRATNATETGAVVYDQGTNYYLSRHGGSAQLWVEGDLAEHAIWSSVLSTSQITELQSKIPGQVGSPAIWHRILGTASPEPDDVGDLDLTLTGTTQSTHPDFGTVPTQRGTTGAAVASAGNVVNPTNLVPVLPAHQVGDLLLCYSACRSATPTVAIPSGWTQLVNVTGTVGRLALFGKIAASASETNPTVTWSGLTTGSGGTPVQAQCAVFMNTQLSTDVLGAVENAAGSTTVVASGAAITTLTADDLVLSLAFRPDDAGTWTVPSGFTLLGSAGTTSGADMAIGWSYQVKAVAGSSAPADYSIAGATSQASTGIQIALKETVAGTPVNSSDASGATTEASSLVARPTAPDVNSVTTESLAPSYESSIDDFNRADARIDAGAGVDIWTSAWYNSGDPSDVRVISNQLGILTDAWTAAYTKIETQKDCDIVVDFPVAPGPPNTEAGLFFLMGDEGTTGFDCYAVFFSGGTWILRRYANGVSQGNITTASGSLANGDIVWIYKRASMLKVFRKPSGAGYYTEILSATDANLDQQGVIAVELSDNDQRWDNLRGGPLVVVGTPINSSDINGATTEASSLVASPATTDVNGVTTESAQVTFAAASTDANGVTTEAVTLVARPTAADANGTTTETQSVQERNVVNSSDAGTGVDTATAKAVLSVTDSNSVTTETSSLVARPTSADINGAVVESASTVQVTQKSGSDTGTATETATISVPVAAADSGISTQAGTLAAQLASADSNGSTTEVANVGQLFVVGSDVNGPVTEATSLIARPTAVDSGSTIEGANITFSNQSSDSAIGSETYSVVAAVASSQTGVSSEIGTVQLIVTADDFGAVSDAEQVYALVGAVESAIGIDSAVAGAESDKNSHDFAVGVESATIAERIIPFAPVEGRVVVIQTTNGGVPVQRTRGRIVRIR